MVDLREAERLGFLVPRVLAGVGFRGVDVGVGFSRADKRAVIARSCS